LKRRPLPTSINHPSVGTEGEIAARAEVQNALTSLQLSGDLLESLVHPVSMLQEWGYFMDIPPGEGGSEPSIEGKIAKCDRCIQYFVVKRMEEADNCVYHWGKPRVTRVGGEYCVANVFCRLISLLFPGEKIRTYTCCSRPVADSEGCSHGPHVFYESAPDDLHSRHAFSCLSPSNGDNNMHDVVALDCEMIYTTGGMRVARVSVVDGSGKEIFDQLVRLDDDVHVM
jgi:RNA exonuclease 1